MRNLHSQSKIYICILHKINYQRYILLDSLLFKLNTSSEKETALLAIPEICADQIITLYHSSLFAGHQGVIKTYLNIVDKFFIPDLVHYLCSYIKVVTYVNFLTKTRSLRAISSRIKLSRQSMDLKVMPKSHKGHRFILCVIDEVTNYLITIPIYHARSEKNGDP